MDSIVGSELVHSMLNAAGSMQRLTEELDRISLPPEDTNDHDSSTSRHRKRKSRTKSKPREQVSHENVLHWTPEWTPERTQLSHKKGDLNMEDSSSELSGYEQPSTPSRMSNASSKFDSAFGSFHSQTDEDSLHSWSLSPSTVPPYDNYSEEMQTLTQHLALQNLLYDSSRAREPPHLPPSSKEKHHRHHQSTSMHQKHSAPHTAAALDSPSPQRVPSSAHRKKKKHHMSNRKNVTTSTGSHSPSRSGIDVPNSYAHEPWYPSTYSHSSSSSSLYDPRVHTTHSHTMSHESPVEVMYRTEQGGETPPVEEPEFQLHSNDERRKQCVTHHYSDSSGSTTPTASEMDEAKPRRTVPFHIRPQIVANPLPRYGVAWQQVPAQREKKEPANASAKQPSGAHKHKLVTLRLGNNDVKEGTEVSEGWTTMFYQENITPQPSPQLPHRYHQPSPQLPRRYRDIGTSLQRVTPIQEGANPLKRSASILQRLKRRKHGSFRYERRPKRHLPVKRAFSDRIAYQIRKGWIDYDEDLELISNPSRPRTIGRMVDTHAGRHHIVELHKPPSGRYGIYISEGGAFRRGIFISRFAEGVAAKFYSGLLSPGDEIIEVNGQPIYDKSLDYVYNMLASLDSVLLMILPVSARSDWC